MHSIEIEFGDKVYYILRAQKKNTLMPVIVFAGGLNHSL